MEHGADPISRAWGGGGGGGGRLEGGAVFYIGVNLSIVLYLLSRGPFDEDGGRAATRRGANHVSWTDQDDVHVIPGRCADRGRAVPALKRQAAAVPDQANAGGAAVPDQANAGGTQDLDPPTSPAFSPDAEGSVLPDRSANSPKPDSHHESPAFSPDAQEEEPEIWDLDTESEDDGVWDDPPLPVGEHTPKKYPLQQNSPKNQKIKRYLSTYLSTSTYTRIWPYTESKSGPCGLQETFGYLLWPRSLDSLMRGM